MSGDVQPRKRKDKKRKKDELSAGTEELHTPGPGARGTAAIFGEGDVFIHTHHDHGTGGHWCAKVIFFSLLAVLITLIGLIILENRGLSELEANSVESRYASVLEGWLEDAPDDDHHDEHTLELKHPDEEEDSGELQTAYQNGDHEDDEEHGDDDEEGDHEEPDHEADDEEQSDENEPEDDLEDENNASEDEDDDEEDISTQRYRYNNDDEQTDTQEDENDDQGQLEDEKEDLEDEQENYQTERADDEENDEVDDQGNDDDDDAYRSKEVDETLEDANSQENYGQENEDEEHDDEDDHDEDEETEVEHIEQEPDEEPISLELPALPQTDEDDNDDQEKGNDDDDDGGDDQGEAEDDDFLEHDDIDNEPPVVERITAPAGKPFEEVEDEGSSEPTPVDTLAEEEEYEQRQEQLRREQEQASHMWLKLGVGAALLLATHAVLRRAAAPRDEPAKEEETEPVREETPVSDRRMTLIRDEPAPPVTPRFIPPPPQKRVITEEMMSKQIPSIVQSAPTPKQISLEEEETVEEEEEEIAPPKTESPAPKEELYSDDEIEEEEEEEDEEVVPKKAEPKPSVPAPPKKEEPKEKTPEPEEDDPDDVEIIEDEDLEEELEEEEISDVDDAELLNRLEAKYGRLPDPERPSGYRPPKDGGNSLDDWPGEPSDPYWRRELDSAERDLRQGSLDAAMARAASPSLASSGRARYIVAKALDELAESRRDNRLLGRAIASYLELLKMNDMLPDKKLLDVAERIVNRMHFRGTYLSAEPVHRLLIRRFPDEPAFRNNLTITYLMANRADLAAEVLKETLSRWPKDRVALAHYAFVLKTHYNRLEEAVDLFQQTLEGDTGPANEPRFYFHLGDSLLLLGRYAEAHEVHKRAAKLGHFLSAAQRSLYNVDRLKSRPWWNVYETPYAKLARALEKSWKAILREGEAARALYVAEKEGLRERGDWSQLDLFARGREIPDRCSRAPVTCSIVQAEPAATGCRRGQIKFSSMEPGTHVRPHVGPTNCRLRMHLALSNTEGTYLRVDKETRQWQVGKVLLFDDSYEHEVWHNGTATRLVLIVDVWHPDLTAAERRSLPAI